METIHKSYPDSEMNERDKQRLAIAAKAPVVKTWYLPRWIPVFIRRILNGFERIDESVYLYYCKWAAWEDGYPDDYLHIASQCSLMAHANGDSRLWLICRWALHQTSHNDPDWES